MQFFFTSVRMWIMTMYRAPIKITTVATSVTIHTEELTLL